MQTPRIENVSPGRFLEALAKVLAESSSVVYLPQPVHVTLATGIETSGEEASFSVIGRFSVPDEIFEPARVYHAELGSEAYRLRDIPISLAYFTLVSRRARNETRDLLVLPKRLCRSICSGGCHRCVRPSSKDLDAIQCRVFDEMLRILGGAGQGGGSIESDPVTPYCFQ